MTVLTKWMLDRFRNKEPPPLAGIETMKPIETEKFLRNYAVAVSELSRLLKTRFTPKRPGATALGQSLAQIMMLHLAGEYVGRDIEFVRVKFLVTQLQRIEGVEPAILRKLVKPLKVARNIDRFYGIRFEVNIAATLIRNEIQFDKQETPDFRVHWRAIQLGIECAGLHIRKAKEREDYLYKIDSKIFEKEKQSYCNNQTGLFLDITNLAYHAYARGVTWTKEQLRHRVSDSVANSSFGSVTCFTYLFNADLDRFQSSYVRVDHPRISDDLRAFMDRVFPVGQEHVEQAIVLEEG